MARTQAADYEERREAIVERAADLFASRGFLGASVSDIAKACKTSKSLLYHYYPSKEDVLYAVMLSHVDRLVDEQHRYPTVDPVGAAQPRCAQFDSPLILAGGGMLPAFERAREGRA